MHYFPMKLSRKNLAVLVCTAALGLGACGGGDSWNQDGDARDRDHAGVPGEAGRKADSPTSSATSTDDDREVAGRPTTAMPSRQSPGSAISLTASAVPLGPRPEDHRHLGGRTTRSVPHDSTRTDRADTWEWRIDDCSGTHEFGLVAGVAETRRRRRRPRHRNGQPRRRRRCGSPFPNSRRWPSPGRIRIREAGAFATVLSTRRLAVGVIGDRNWARISACPSRWRMRRTPGSGRRSSPT